jgi:enoyl-CoA hydratase/carnithine racemase
VPVVAFADLFDVARSPLAHDALGLPAGGGWVLTAAPPSEGAEVPAGVFAHLSCVLVAIASPSHPLAGTFDVVVADERAATDVTNAIDANPVAATALALLLRGGRSRTVAEGLVAESATYSTLQSGAEHRAWLAARDRRPRGHTVPAPVRVVREGNTLHVTLDRPDVRNAYDAATRDALLDACTIATTDTSIERLLVDGSGPAFSSGGDLDEFGTLADPASAHPLRLARSVAYALHRLRDRTTVYVHGPCIGAGVELPAFASRVVARRDATFRLPEVAMGLVPGAGGTVSIPRRIGRHRTAWWAITGTTIAAPAALAWGLVDEVADPTGN